MKKFTAILIVLFFLPVTAFADDVCSEECEEPLDNALAWSPLVVNADVPTSGGDTCPSATYELGYDGDHDDGADYACYEDGPGNEQGTTTDATVTSSNVSFSACDDDLQWTITGDLSAGLGSEGSMFFTFQYTDDGDSEVEGEITLVTLWYNGGNRLTCHLDGYNKDSVKCEYRATSGPVQTVFHPGNGSMDGEGGNSYRCGYSWQAGADTAGTHHLYCVQQETALSSWAGDEDLDDIDTFTSDPTIFGIGDSATYDAEIGCTFTETSAWVKDVYIVTGYESADPLP